MKPRGDATLSDDAWTLPRRGAWLVAVTMACVLPSMVSATCRDVRILLRQGYGVADIADAMGVTPDQIGACVGGAATSRSMRSRQGAVGPAPWGAAGPPPLGAAGPPPLGAAGPAPLGAAGPPPLGAAGPAPRGAAGPPPLGAAGPAPGH